MKKNRRFSEIILDNLTAKERKESRQIMAAFWLALPLAIIQLWIL